MANRVVRCVCGGGGGGGEVREVGPVSQRRSRGDGVR